MEFAHVNCTEVINSMIKVLYKTIPGPHLRGWGYPAVAPPSGNNEESPLAPVSVSEPCKL